MKSKSITKQVFLSHTRKDRPLADALIRELQRQGLTVWDDQSISPGADWSKEIAKALKESFHINKRRNKTSNTIIKVIMMETINVKYTRNFTTQIG